MGTTADTQKPSIRGTAPLIPADHAIEQLTAQWPGLVIEEILPPEHPLKLHLRGTLPDGGMVGIRILAAAPDDPHGNQRLKAAYHRAQEISRLANPGTARILQVGNLAGCLLIVSEWIEGQRLAAFREQAQPDTGTILDMIDVLAETLETFHNAGWVHGHLRSDDVLVTERGEVLLCGHGIMDVLTGHIPGPLDRDRIYMAPELNGREEGERQMVGDVYSLGVVAYEFLTGDRPTGHFMKLPCQVTEAGKWLDDVILRAIHPDPALRIPTVEAFRANMESQELRLMDLDAVPEQEEEVTGRNRRRKRPVAASGIMAELRVSFTLLMCFSVTMIGASIYYGAKWHQAQQESRMSVKETVLAMGRLIAAMAGEGEGLDVDAILSLILEADPETQRRALVEQIAALQEAGQHNDALLLANQLVELHKGKEGSPYDAMRAIQEALAAAPGRFSKYMARADEALMAGDLKGELTALTEALKIYPNDPTALKRLSQTPKYFAASWETAERELQRWNPRQKHWHVTTHRGPGGLDLDLSGHQDLAYLNPIKSLPIDRLNIQHTAVRDLTHLADMNLSALWCDHSNVSELTALRNQPLERLSLTHTRIFNYDVLDQLAFLKYLRVDAGLEVRSIIPLPVNKTEWENGLGMRFLPIPHSENHLVAVQELNQADYSQSVSLEGKGASDEPSATSGQKALLYPALMTLHEATTFCEWLTTREQKAGYLQEGAFYRLPEPSELEALQEYVQILLPEKSDVTTSLEEHPVAQGPCLRGFFDVLDNAPEWHAKRTAPGEAPEMHAEENVQRALRLVLDLSSIKPPPSEPSEPSG